MEATTKMMSSREVMSLIRASAKPYYVYVLYRPCGKPFYVGKGCGRRVQVHERQAKSTTRRTHKLAVIRKIHRDGMKVGYGIDSWHDDDASAIAREIALIAEVGRRDLKTGPLTNCTSGGDTTEVGPVSRAKISAALKKYFSSQEVRARMSELSKIRCGTPEFSRKMAEIQREYYAANPERAKHRDARLTQYHADPMLAAELDAKRRAGLLKPGVREKMSVGRRRWATENPEAAAKQEANRLASLRSPVTIAKRQATLLSSGGNNANAVAKMRLHATRRIVRLRCDILIRHYGLPLKPCRALASIDELRSFEDSVHSLIAETTDAKE